MKSEHTTSFQSGKGIWFSSDMHYGHVNIIRHCKRPFKDVHDMNETLIRNWNSVIKKNALVYMLGDICWRPIRKTIEHLYRLNGRKFLIAGNHDEKARQDPEFQQQFEWIKDYHQLKVEGDGETRLVVMSHYPSLSWNKMHHNSIMCHGHTHNTLPLDRNSKRIDVGVDAHSYYPISYEHLIGLADKLKFKAVDHHGQRR
jgi:calcineurin-like phosphoesterase family protein